MKKWVNILISVCITLLFLRVFVSLFKDADFTGIKSANLLMLMPAALCYVMTYPLRACRIFYLTQQFGTKFSDVLPICMRHQFFGRIIPFKAGELSLVYLLNKNCSVPILSSGAVLGLIRIFDAVIMLSGFLISSIFVKTSGVATTSCGLALIFLITGVILAVIFFSKIRLIASKKDGNFWNYINQLCDFFHSTSAKGIFLLLFQTVFLWIFVYLSMHFVAKAFLPSLSFVQSVSASFLASAAAFLPVNGLGGFGTTEAGWTIGFMLMGMERQAALVSGLTSNIMSFVIVCIFGIVSFLKGGNHRCMK